MNKFIQEEKAKGGTANLGKVPENLHTVIHDAENHIKTHPYFLYYQMFFASNKETHQVPAPPYMILDKEGHEVQRFNSLDALVIFSNSKDKPFTTLQNMTYEGFKQIENEVREFIKIGDIDNAIASLEHILEGSQYNNFFTDLALYKSNYNKSKQLYSKNLIESSEYNRDRTRVENGILDMANSLRGIIMDKI
jgi:Effector-associated domain 11